MNTSLVPRWSAPTRLLSSGGDPHKRLPILISSRFQKIRNCITCVIPAYNRSNDRFVFNDSARRIRPCLFGTVDHPGDGNWRPRCRWRNITGLVWNYWRQWFDLHAHGLLGALEPQATFRTAVRASDACLADGPAHAHHEHVRSESPRAVHSELQSSIQRERCHSTR